MFSILSSILGFATAGLPSILGFFQQKGDQAHEREMAKLQNEQTMAMAQAGFQSQEKVAAIDYMSQMNEVQGEELSHDIALIGGTLKKIETMIDFGRDQDQDVEEGLQTVLNILIDIQHKLETTTKDASDMGGASKFYQMENILKQMGK